MTPDRDEPMPDRPQALDALRPLRMSAAQRAALWARVETSAAAAVELPTPEASGSSQVRPAGTPAAGVGAGLAWGVPALVTGLVIGAVVGRTVFPPEPKIVERVVVKTEQVRVEVPVPKAPLPQSEIPAPAPAKAEKIRIVPREPKPSPLAEVPTGTETNVERQLLEGVRNALMRRDASSALASLERLDREFPRGHLVEERASLKIQALQQAHRDADAKAAAKAFLEHYPQSIFGPAVEAVLQEKP